MCVCVCVRESVCVCVYACVRVGIKGEAAWRGAHRPPCGVVFMKD